MKKTNCGICNIPLEIVLDLGLMPISHRMHSTIKEQEQEPMHPLALSCCSQCGLAHIVDPIPPEELYKDYNFCFSSWKSQPHMDDEVDIINTFKEVNRVLEVGSNDGFFQELVEKNCKVSTLGVEPNLASANIARNKGLSVINDFFTEEIASDIAKDGGCEVLVARQVVEHLPDLGAFFRAADIALSDNGYLMIEVPDVEPLLDSGDVTFIWEEHVNYFGEASLTHLLNHYGFGVSLVKRYNFSGVALLIVAKREGNRRIAPNDGKNILEKYRAFSQKLSRYQQDLENFILASIDKGAKIAIYGSGCRANMFLNSLNSDTKKVDYVIDDQPEKLGFYMPGICREITPLNSLKEKNYIFFLLVNNENNDVVTRKIERKFGEHAIVCSVTGPGDISENLQLASKQMIKSWSN